MELIDQEDLPHGVEFLPGVRRDILAGGDGSQKFQVVEQELALAIPLLGGRLGGVRAAVQLEVEFADHPGQVLAVVFQALEELRRRADGGARQALQILGPAEPFEHVAGGAAAAVAHPEQHVALARTVAVLVLPHDPPEFLHGGHRVVGVGRRKVGEHLAAVDSLPQEGLVPGFVEVVPRQLLGEKVADAGLAHDLRQLAVIPEHVRVPELAAEGAELALEEALAVQELAAERLARRDVAVGLHPGAAHGHPLPGVELLLDPVVQVRVALFHGGVLGGLRAGELVLRVQVHVQDRRAEGARALAPGLLDRPQPGGVDVGVAHGAELVPVRGIAVFLQFRGDLAGPRPGVAVLLVELVGDPVQFGE